MSVNEIFRQLRMALARELIYHPLLCPILRLCKGNPLSIFGRIMPLADPHARNQLHDKNRVPRRRSGTPARRTSNIFHMTEQQIIERIRATTDERLLATELQRNLATQDYLNVVLAGRREAVADYLNSS